MREQTVQETIAKMRAEREKLSRRIALLDRAIVALDEFDKAFPAREQVCTVAVKPDVFEWLTQPVAALTAARSGEAK